jgi:probable rRNA maturation factor
MKAKAYLEIEGESGLFRDYEILNLALGLFCEQTNQSGEVVVSLVFCQPDEMQQINKKYRGDDKTTDVLSFPTQQLPETSYKENSAGRFLGEILIDINYIIEHKETDELSKAVLQVFIHGLLHLIGFDHLNTQQKNIMQEMENNIMNSFIQAGNFGR